MVRYLRRKYQVAPIPSPLQRQAVEACGRHDLARFLEIAPDDRVRFKDFGLGFWGITAHYGFMETPDVPDLLLHCASIGLKIDMADTSYYLGRETLLPTRDRSLAYWRKRLFRFLSRNSRSATDFFSIPANRVVEIGTQIEL